MASTDDAFALIIAELELEKGILAAAEQLPDGNLANLDAKFFRQAEDNLITNL